MNIELLKKGDPDAFTEMYNKYSKMVYNFILIKVKNEHVAEDVLSETFFSAIKSASKIINDKNLLSWLLTIASRRLNDHFRKNAKNTKIIDSINKSEIYEDYNIVDKLNLKEQTLFLDMAMKQLPDEYRKAILFRYFDKNSQKEIALKLNKTESAVETILVRGKKMIKEELNKLKGFYYEK